MAEVTIRQLRKSFGSVEVIRGVDIDIPDGEFVVLVGPSGCGKSTLLRMIAGLEDVTAGTIRIGERVVNNLPPAERDIAMVFQNYALYPHKTVAANLAFSLKVRKTDRAIVKQRVEQAAETLGLTPYLHRYPRQLRGSGTAWRWRQVWWRAAWRYCATGDGPAAMGNLLHDCKPMPQFANGPLGRFSTRAVATHRRLRCRHCERSTVAIDRFSNAPAPSGPSRRASSPGRCRRRFRVV